jgi:membrane dipeptidase
MKKSRREFISNVAVAGVATVAGSSAAVYAGEEIPSPTGSAGEPQSQERSRPGGVHSVLERDHPYIFVDSCMQIWPDADLANAHRHGVTAYGVTAWDPHADVGTALEGLMYWHLVARKHPNLLVAMTVDDIRRAKRERRSALLLAAQDGDWIGNKLHRLEAFQRLGLRMMLPAYNRTNHICDGCLDRTESGLTRFGQLVVEESNRVGILLDCSHLGKRSSLDIIERSSQPCVFSHSNPSALAPNPRNIDDEQIKACVRRGGIIGLVAWGPLVLPPGGTGWPTVDRFIDMIDHVAAMDGGTDHIGLSTDMSLGTYPDHTKDPWGDPVFPSVSGHYDKAVTSDIRSPMRNLNGFSDYSHVVSFAEQFLVRGFGDADVHKILGGNFLRVFDQAWRGR